MFRFLRLALCFLLLGARAFGQPAILMAYSPGGLLSVGTVENPFLDFSCVLAEKNQVRLQWRTAGIGGGDYFVIERSSDGLSFETVGALRREADSSFQYQAQDNNFLTGSYYYRVKIMDRGGKYLFSKTQKVQLSPDLDVKFYPNPVDKMLIIRSSHEVEVLLTDGSGTAVLSSRLASGIQTLNLSNLQKGTYALRIRSLDNMQVVSTQLIKN